MDVFLGCASLKLNKKFDNYMCLGHTQVVANVTAAVPKTAITARHLRVGNQSEILEESALKEPQDGLPTTSCPA